MNWPHIIERAGSILRHPEQLSPEQWMKLVLHPLPFAFVCLAFFGLAGRMEKLRPGQYKSRSFLHDLAYWSFYLFGFYDAIFTAALFQMLNPYFVHVNLLGDWPMVPRYIMYWLVVDFTHYWCHRFRHSVGFVWAFHTTHHAEERLTFASEVHLHPVEMFISAIFLYFPIIILGAEPVTIIWLSFLSRMALAWQHSELPWRCGPLYYIFVTPAFHGFHHSTNPRHYNKNYGVTLSIWDFIFRTAVDEKELPTEYGLPDVKMPTLTSQMVVPFKLIREWYFKKPALQPRPEQSDELQSRAASAGD